MNKAMNDASKSAKSVLREIESRLRDDGYDAQEVEEVCFAARAKIEERLATSNRETDFSDIIDDFTSPEFAPEHSDQARRPNALGLIALSYCLIIIVLFATVPFLVGEDAGGAAMLSLAIIAAPVGGVLGWKSRHQRLGMIALGLSTLPIIGLCLSVALHLLE
jgi:hypothetical protein